MKKGKRKIKFYKTKVINFGFFVLILFVFLSCNNNGFSAKNIIEQTVETYGGIDNWEEMNQLSFDKNVTLFSENGKVERETEQFQLYQFQKSFGKIEWEEDSISHMIIYENDSISKLENNEKVNSTRAIENAKRAFFASEFVIKQPFNLLEKGVKLTKENDTTINDKTCFVISALYKNKTKSPDKWYYIIDKNSYLIVANKVELKDHTSWIENLTYNQSPDFIFNAHRKSYRLNKTGEKTYLRAEYFYENYAIY